MNKIDNLKTQLAQAEEAEENKKVEQELDNMRPLIGKCYASHLLNRYMTTKPAFTFELAKIVDAVYQGSDNYQPYQYKIERVVVRKINEKFDISINTVFDRDNGLFKHEITAEQFIHVKETIKASMEKTLDTIRFNFKHNEYLSQGNQDKKVGADQKLEEVDIEYLDLVDNPRLVELLRWNNHPYLFTTKLFKSDGWLEIIVNITNKIEANAKSWGGSIWERDSPRIALLRRFINSQRK